jgi:hypothetical protein
MAPPPALGREADKAQLLPRVVQAALADNISAALPQAA